jgi:hypothetical protein
MTIIDFKNQPKDNQPKDKDWFDLRDGPDARWARQQARALKAVDYIRKVAGGAYPSRFSGTTLIDRKMFTNVISAVNLHRGKLDLEQL